MTTSESSCILGVDCDFCDDRTAAWMRPGCIHCVVALYYCGDCKRKHSEAIDARELELRSCECLRDAAESAPNAIWFKSVAKVVPWVSQTSDAQCWVCNNVDRHTMMKADANDGPFMYDVYVCQRCVDTRLLQVDEVIARGGS